MSNITEMKSEYALRPLAGHLAVARGLGPKQLTWLRRNITSFKHAEEQWHQMRQDKVQAARVAGLI